jgi:NAD(P)-dependent dehydrogenase (short-subunit alcohol dehydrogenase family)
LEEQQRMTCHVVTGGSSGVGAALVQRLVARGGSVFNIDRAPPAAADGARWVACDLGEPDAIARACDALPADIDGLANVAGMARAADPMTVMAVNFLGMRELTRRLTPRLTAGSGIVCVSSIAGRDWRRRLDTLRPLLATGTMTDGLAWCRAHAGVFERDPYTWSKRAVTAWVLAEASVHVHTSTRILAVSPGGIDTPLSPQFEALMGKAQLDWTNAQTGRAARPEEIAEVLDTLLCQPCGWLNGVDVPVDRGYTAGLDAGWIDFDSSPIMRARSARAKD